MQRLKQKMPRFTRQRAGLSTLEWVLLMTVLVIGVAGTLAGVRAVLGDSFLEMAEAIESMYTP